MSMESAIKALTAEENILLHFRDRLAAVREIQAEIVRRAGSNSFVIANELVWHVILDNRDALVIHLASWAKGNLGAGGLFGHLRQLPAKTFFVARVRDRRDTKQAISMRHRRSRFEATFPEAAARGSLKHEDWDALATRFRSQFDPIMDDRDQLRAHRYEKGDKANAQAVGVAEVSDALELAEDILNALRTCAGGGEVVYSEHLPPGAGDTASDMIDLLMFGSILALVNHTIDQEGPGLPTGRFWWQQRAAFISRLKQLHSAGDPALPVNDERLVRQAAEDIADGVLAKTMTDRTP